MIRLTLAILFFQFIATVSAQTNSIQETSLKNKKIIYYSSISGIALTSQIGLNELWYKNYPRTNFHFFNDNKEWLQIDKVGHAFSAYQLSQTFFAIHPEKEIHPFKASCIGSTIAFSYLLGIELMDSKSASWGFSSGDILANTSGIFFSFLNQSTRMKNNFQFKFSYTNSSYSNLRPDVFGRNFQQRIFKDYNGQTYWLSIHPFPKHRRNNTFKRIFELSFGYGINEMMYADNNINSVNNFHSQREFLLSFDADLNQIKWKRKWMKNLVKIFNIVKIPSPTIQIQSDGKVKILPLYF